jgi:predicted DNA-binding protein (UPF0251 family)/predicted Fe-Mo cluster-binding NifX family protein
MAREKNTRKLSFKPLYESFIPENESYNGISSLLHEEIEAIYLMDVLNMYQEEAAKNMEVSRPTFTRILKNARQKVATALVSGYKINIEDSKDDLVLAFCSDDQESLKYSDPKQKYIYIYQIKKESVKLIEKVENPVFTDDLKPAIVLPSLFMDKKVNIFFGSTIGEGLKNSLISKGIKPVTTEKIKSIDDFKTLL